MFGRPLNFTAAGPSKGPSPEAVGAAALQVSALLRPELSTLLTGYVACAPVPCQ
jgi:hypothetical protein